MLRKFSDTVAEQLRAPWLSSGGVLPACLAVGLAVRLAIVLLMDVQPVSDAQWYFSRAIELSRGMGYQEGGHPTAYWPVGYPAFLAGLFVLFGESVRAGQLANVAAWAITLWLLHATVRRLSGEPRAANLAVLLYSVHLNAVGYTGLLLTETLFVAMLVGAWWLATQLSEGRARAIVPLGLLLGLMTLVKAQTWIAVVLWAGIAVALTSSDRLRAALRMSAVIAIMFATVLPWSVRNLHTLGSFVLVSTNGGLSLAVTNHANGRGSDDWERHPEREYIAQGVRDQIGADRRAREVTFRWIRENPGDFLALAPRKFWWALVPDGESEWGYQAGYAHYERDRLVFRTLRWVNQCIYFLLGALALWSLWSLAYRHRELLRRNIVSLGLVAGYLGMFLAITFVFNGQSRYHFPLLAPLCGVGGWMIASRLARTR